MTELSVARPFAGRSNSAAPPAAPTDREMGDLVQKMSAYVAGGGAELSVIVGVEKYTRHVTVEERPVRPRMLVSEFAMVKAAGRVGWSGFRGVVEVDGKAVRIVVPR